MKRLKMTKPQSRGKAKGGARTVQAKPKRKRQSGGKFDIQKWILKLAVEFHWPEYQYMGPGTKLAKRLKRGDPGINRLNSTTNNTTITHCCFLPATKQLTPLEVTQNRDRHELLDELYQSILPCLGTGLARPASILSKVSERRSQRSHASLRSCSQTD